MFATVECRCDRCGTLVKVPDGATPRQLTTGGPERPTAHVIRMGNTNVHRCQIGAGSDVARPEADANT
jgi:hypothetical protein